MACSFHVFRDSFGLAGFSRVDLLSPLFPAISPFREDGQGVIDWLLFSLFAGDWFVSETSPDVVVPVREVVVAVEVEGASVGSVVPVGAAIDGPKATSGGRRMPWSHPG